MQDAFWVFAYGSLMWRPGFPVAETRPARVHGYHRAMCVISQRYRGTRDVPGMVLGLDRGGSCWGMGLRVARTRVKTVVAYLYERELTGGIYDARTIAARLDDGREIEAMAFIVRRDHASYAGDYAPAKMAAMIRQASGTHGTARDYLANTVAHLEEMDLHDRSLHRLLKLVDGAKR